MEAELLLVFYDAYKPFSQSQHYLSLSTIIYVIELNKILSHNLFPFTLLFEFFCIYLGCCRFCTSILFWCSG